MSDAGPPAARTELPVLNSGAPTRPTSGRAAYRLLEPYDTGRPCLYSDCPGTFQGRWVVSKSGIRKVKVTRSEHREKQCSQCGFRFAGNEFHPCSRFEANPRSGIRYDLPATKPIEFTRGMNGVSVNTLRIKRIDEHFQNIQVQALPLEKE
jgi:hypothetical protein